MPDAVKYPEMYDVCYRLMKLTWDAAKAEEEGWEDRSAMWAAIRAGKDVPDIIVTS
jgi:head-tail adaptor